MLPEGTRCVSPVGKHKTGYNFRTGDNFTFVSFIVCHSVNPRRYFIRCSGSLFAVYANMVATFSFDRLAVVPASMFYGFVSVRISDAVETLV
jgi:hypothetical protein